MTIYKDPRIVLRKHRQRYDRSVLPTLCHLSPDGTVYDVSDLKTSKPIGTGVVCDTFIGVDGYGRQCKYDAVEVHLDNGDIIPAYRKHAPAGDNDWNVCQRFAYKGVYHHG